MSRMRLALADRFIPAADLREEGLSESLRLQHSSCDVPYFVLARSRGTASFTLDRRLQELCLNSGADCASSDAKSEQVRSRSFSMKRCSRGLVCRRYLVQ